MAIRTGLGATPSNRPVEIRIRETNILRCRDLSRAAWAAAGSGGAAGVPAGPGQVRFGIDSKPETLYQVTGMSQESQVSTVRRSVREINCDARRDRILEAARGRIARGGMAALTMRTLAREAGLSVTTLYNLLGGRDAIVTALIEDSIDQMDAALDREAPLEDPIERCRAVVRVSIRHIALNEASFRPMLLAGLYRRSGRSKGALIASRAARMQSVAIEEAIAMELLSPLLDPAVLGRQIYHGYELAMIQWATGEIDVAGFEARALYGLYVALLGIASDVLRPSIEAELRSLERTLAALDVTSARSRPEEGPRHEEG